MTGQTRPNILVVVFDSLSEKACVDRAAELPTLSGLRKGAIRFLNTYAPSPESGPARASLFTGLDMATHGVWTDGVALPAKEKPFPERFAECGYRTWLVGRRQLAGVSNWTTEHARPNEYCDFEWAHGPLHRSRQNGYLSWLQESDPETYASIFPKQANPDDTETPVWQREAMETIPDNLSFNHWIGARAAALLTKPPDHRPFLGVLGIVVGETMGGAPGDRSPCEGLNENALRQADAALGTVMRRLETEGQAESTALIVTAARGSVFESSPEHPLQESAIKVPLMIHLPGHPAGSVEPAVSTMDIAPTLHRFAQVPPPLRSQGMPLLANGMVSQPRGWALARLRNPARAWQTALRTDPWKLVISHGSPDEAVPPTSQLFDLQSDPGETQDLAASEAHQTILEEMIDTMVDARVALENRTEPRIAKF